MAEHMVDFLIRSHFGSARRFGTLRCVLVVCVAPMYAGSLVIALHDNIL